MLKTMEHQKKQNIEMEHCVETTWYCTRSNLLEK